VRLLFIEDSQMNIELCMRVNQALAQLLADKFNSARVLPSFPA